MPTFMATMLVPQKKNGEMRSRNAANWPAGSTTASAAPCTCCGGCVLLRPASVQAACQLGSQQWRMPADAGPYQARDGLQPDFSCHVRSAELETEHAMPARAPCQDILPDHDMPTCLRCGREVSFTTGHHSCLQRQCSDGMLLRNRVHPSLGLPLRWQAVQQGECQLHSHQLSCRCTACLQGKTVSHRDCCQGQTATAEACLSGATSLPFIGPPACHKRMFKIRTGVLILRRHALGVQAGADTVHSPLAGRLSVLLGSSLHSGGPASAVVLGGRTPAVPSRAALPPGLAAVHVTG